MLKSLIVWLMLLAMPFQGFASATMLLCTPISAIPATQPAATAHGAGHDHAAMLAAQSAQHGQHAGDAAAAGDAGDAAAPDHHNGGKCGSCATCCFGASIAPHASAVPVQLPHFESIPFASAHQPAVDLALPERPPQAVLA